MCVDAFDDEAVLFDNVWDGTVFDDLVPDTETGGWTSNVGLTVGSGGGGESSGADTWVDTEANNLALAFVVLSDALNL